ncbi:MAG: DUF2213 domain-containing protein [Halobacteriota archaeon]
MVEKEDLGNPEIDTLLAELASNPTTDDDDAEYPLPENKPVKFSGVDVVILPKGYKSEYPKPEDAKPRFSDSLPSMKLDVANAEEADGVLSVPVTVANAKHIYDYDGLKVLKPFEELEAAALFADGIPITREHPSAGIVTDRRQVLGFFKSPTAKDDLLKGILAITDKDLIADVKDKKLTEVSAGFFCDLDDTLAGELEGVPYDATQKNIFLNHVAVVENGRCSIDDGCGIGLDAKKYPVPSDLVDKIKAAIARAKAMKDKSLYNLLKELLKGVSVKKDSGESKKMPDAEAINLVKVKDAFAKITAERDLLKDKLEEVKNAGKDAVIEEHLSLQDTLTREDLEGRPVADLIKDVDMLKQRKAKHLSAPDSSQSSGGGSITDAAYRKVGEGGK